MDLKVNTMRNYAVIAPQGRLTAVGAPSLRKALNHLLEQGNVRIVVDLSETAFIDSSGLGALIGGLKAARLAQGDLRIAAPTPAVSSVLKLTNLDKVLRAYPSAETAYHGG
ncbi:STAS domain-containing protein [Nesterenkonia salmonea]|uniref:Anti-sigma factor antagonist n=1 Tax=Nesterenkonia salmonea TaxID=1804987 RepID=A0A5R9BA40_9MICC|nr:STAS domain-containing protein [Nesterenkonia salmonea]TLP96548.1 STAS domain-containing protein [Nesterenkonia salmonea]